MCTVGSVLEDWATSIPDFTVNPFLNVYFPLAGFLLHVTIQQADSLQFALKTGTSVCSHSAPSCIQSFSFVSLVDASLCERGPLFKPSVTV